MQLNVRKGINKIGTFRKYLVRNNNNIQTRKASDNKDSIRLFESQEMLIYLHLD